MHVPLYRLWNKPTCQRVSLKYRVQLNRATVSAGAPAVFPSIQTTPAVVSAGAPAVFPSIQTTPAVVSAGTPTVFPPGTRAEASSVQTTSAKVSAGSPGVFPPKSQAVLPSVQTAPAIVSAGAPAEASLVQTAQTIVSAGSPGVFQRGTRAVGPEVSAFVDEAGKINSSSEESPHRRSRMLAPNDSGDLHRRCRLHSLSDDSSDGDSLVHKKRRRTASPVKVKQEPTGGDKNDVDMKSETRGTDSATVDDSGNGNGNDSSPVKIKEEPGGSNEKYVDMNSKTNHKQINDSQSNNNDNVYTEDWFARVLRRYPPSSFLRSPFTSPSTYHSSLSSHGEESSSDKSRRHLHEHHRLHESSGEDSLAAKTKKKHRESLPVKVKQEPPWRQYFCQ